MESAASVIRQARRVRGVSQAELARRTGIAQPTISGYERGQHEPSLKTLKQLVEGTGLTLELRLHQDGARRRLPTTVLGSLLNERSDELIAIGRRYGASNIRVFGSVARGDDGLGSDVDLLVDLAPSTSLIDLGNLEEAFSQLLERTVDVVPASALKPRLRDAVLTEAIPLESP